ncbi:MAG: ATP-binding cassette domain-containing protein [Armatimonadetes bacterium]|nr:ATP-binding cassette domain-containing protein [Armatimonadota bacterium]
MAVIRVENLSKTYFTHKRQPGVGGAIVSLFKREKEAKPAVKSINFSIEEGELVGFLGPNGAGKTTTLKMLAGIIFPTEGRAEVLGYVPWDHRPEMQRQISLVVGQKMQLWWDLPAYESFVLLKALYDVPDDVFEKRVNEMAEMLEVEKLIHTQVRRMSLGERMKCELIAALIHMPKVVFLDEPTIGLDVVSQKRIRDFLKEHNRRNNATILLTSHYMQDVQELSERVIIIDHGELIFDDTLTKLAERFSPNRALNLTFTEAVDRADLEPYGQVIRFEGLQACIEAPREQITQTAARLLAQFPIADIAISEIDIEEIVRDVFSRSSAERAPA